MAQVNLNIKQEEAVNHKSGPLLIIAGAGTGKTATITKRIQNIIKQGWAEREEVLALTFTEKAAAEMLDRVEEELSMGYGDCWISTFHSFCDRILRLEGHFIGLDTNYTLMTSAQSYILFRRHLFDMPLDNLRPLGNPTKFIQDILKHFSRLQDEDISPDEYIKFAKKALADKGLTDEERVEKGLYPEIIELAECYKVYTDIKLKESKLDFGDLITLTLRLLREKPFVLKKYQEKFKYILVDEFQDTNYAQNILVNLLAIFDEDSKSANITVVGDDDQAIYKFRGAAISNILQFKKVYPSAKKVVLTENYRSKQQILDLAYEVIQNNNPDRLEVAEGVMKKLTSQYISDRGISESGTLFSTVSDKKTVQMGQYKNYSEEADFIAKEIELLEGSKKYKYNDMAVLVRSNRNAQEISNTLSYYGIPYKYPGSRGLYTRREISPFVLFLRLLADYTDNVSAFGLLQMEQFGLSPRDLAEISRLATFQKLSIIELIEKSWGIKLGTESIDQRTDRREVAKGLFQDVKSNNFLQRSFSQKGILGICNLVSIMDWAMSMIKKGKSIGEVLFMFFQNSGYMEELLRSEGLTDIQINQNVFYANNISRYFDTVAQYEKDAGNNYVQEYLDYLDYSIEIGDSPNVESDMLDELDAVNITTAHSAKGLEYPVVFIPHLVADRFPSRRRSDSLPVPDDIVKEETAGYDPSKAHLQEERRLFYVAVTRAKERLYLTCAKSYEGLKREKRPSIFFTEASEYMGDLGQLDTDKKVKTHMFEDIEIMLREKEAEEKIVLVDTIKSSSRNGFYASYSALSSYEWCPKKYAYSSIYKIRTPQNASLAFGITIHNVLKELYERLIQAKSSFEGMVDYPDLQFVKRTYEKKWVSAGYDTREHEQRRKKKGLKLLTNYYENFYSKDENPLFLEMSFKYNIDDIVLRGQIDRVDLLGTDDNGKKIVRVIDYKTGTIKKEKYQDNLQLSLYVIFLEQQGYKVQEATYFYVEEEQFLDIDLAGIDKDVIEEKIKGIADKIRGGDFTATPDMFKCKYCDYRAICEDAVSG